MMEGDASHAGGEQFVASGPAERQKPAAVAVQ
jgi:hypothetical protein